MGNSLTAKVDAATRLRLALRVDPRTDAPPRHVQVSHLLDQGATVGAAHLMELVEFGWGDVAVAATADRPAEVALCQSIVDGLGPERLLQLLAACLVSRRCFHICVMALTRLRGLQRAKAAAAAEGADGDLHVTTSPTAPGPAVGDAEAWAAARDLFIVAAAHAPGAVVRGMIDLGLIQRHRQDQIRVLADRAALRVWSVLRATSMPQGQGAPRDMKAEEEVARIELDLLRAATSRMRPLLPRETAESIAVMAADRVAELAPGAGHREAVLERLRDALLAELDQPWSPLAWPAASEPVRERATQVTCALRRKDLDHDVASNVLSFLGTVSHMS